MYMYSVNFRKIFVICANWKSEVVLAKAVSKQLFLLLEIFRVRGLIGKYL